MSSLSEPSNSQDEPDTRSPGPTEGLADERELLARFAETRDPMLREELVTRFLPLARSLAMRYAGGAEPTDDLVQVASVGLMGALERFDPSRGVPFAAFAGPTILGELRRHFRDRVWTLRVPRGLQERIRDVEDAITALASVLERSPTVARDRRETARSVRTRYSRPWRPATPGARCRSTSRRPATTPATR